MKTKCKGCKQKFKIPGALDTHKNKCVALFKKCRWIKSDGSKCKFKGPYGDGFCKRHCIIDYEYNIDGIGENGLEGCGHYTRKKINISSIKSIEDNMEHNFIGRGGIVYEYVKSSVSTVTMKIVDTNENIIFWKDKESRGSKSGHLITTLKTEPFVNYCENIALCRIDDEYYCEKCLELSYGCRIDTFKKKKKSKKSLPVTEMLEKLNIE